MTATLITIDNSGRRFLHALSVDVEDYYHVSGFERDIRREDWPSYASRVGENTQRILHIFATHNVHATFFVLGWVAEQFPQLVAEIAAAGHEIGSHSYWHRLVFTLSPQQFRDDLRRSRDVLQDIIQRPVVLYRAPTYSITEKSRWALDILTEEGFRIDSSISPTPYSRCGMPDAPVTPHVYHTQSGELFEFPVTVASLGRRRFPVGGGGYFRLLPYRLTESILSRIGNVRPLMFYVHPWEIDPSQPRLRAGTRSSRFRHYLNLHKTERRLERLLDRFQFGTLSESLASYLPAVDNATKSPNGGSHAGQSPRPATAARMS